MERQDSSYPHLIGLFEAECRLYEDLESVTLRLRKAVIQGQARELNDAIRDAQRLLIEIAKRDSECAEAVRAEGMIPPEARFSVKAVLESPALGQRDSLRSVLERLSRIAARTAAQMRHNTTLIAKVSEWNEKQMRMVLDALAEPAGYDKGARAEKSAPRLLDTKG